MNRFAKFEVCGLSYVLQKVAGSGREGAHFQLCDEAFNNRPIRIYADRYDDVFQKAEAYIGLELGPETQRGLRSDLGRIPNGGKASNSPCTGLGHAKDQLQPAGDILDR